MNWNEILLDSAKSGDLACVREAVRKWCEYQCDKLLGQKCFAKFCGKGICCGG